MPKATNFNYGALANSEALQRLIDWKLQSPAHLSRHGNRMTAITEGEHMQRQFTIELRVDYEDSDKNEEMKKACAAAARHMFAMAQLLKDSVEPQIAIFADDFFQQGEVISLMDDVIQEGIDAAKMDGTQDKVSSELMGAVREQE